MMGEYDLVGTALSLWVGFFLKCAIIYNYPCDRCANRSMLREGKLLSLGNTGRGGPETDSHLILKFTFYSQYCVKPPQPQFLTLSRVQNCRTQPPQTNIL